MVSIVSPSLHDVLAMQPAYIIHVNGGQYCGITTASRDYAVELVSLGFARFCNRQGHEYTLPIKLHWENQA